MKRETARKAIAIVMGAVFLTGVTAFWDGPLRPCDGPTGYCGKGDRPHTEEQYHWYKIWERTIWTVWPTGILALFILRRRQKR